MADEEMRMTTKDRDRLKVLHEARKRHISQVQAPREWGETPRWVRQLVRRLRKEGDRGVVHRVRGRQRQRKQWMREFLQKPAPPLWKALRDSNAHA